MLRASDQAGRREINLQKPANEFQKFAWLLIAFGIATYAIHGLIADDLVMPYRRWGSARFNTRLFHFHGLWAIIGSVCLLLGAAGFVVLFLAALRVRHVTKPGADPYLYLAAGLILVGTLFLVGVETLALLHIS